MVPRVTNILQTLNRPHLTQWRAARGAAMADAIMADAAHIGTRVHSMIESYHINGARPLTNHPRAQAMVDNYVQWFEAEPRAVVTAERAVSGLSARGLAYRGTLDAIIRDSNGRLILIDIKTGNYMSVTYNLQTAAYARICGYDISERIVLQTSVSGLTEHRITTSMADDLCAFDGLLDVYMYMYNIGQIDDDGMLI